MTAPILARLGQRMRAAQRKYFRTRAAGDLNDAKRLEQEFDRACQDCLDQPTLFDRESTAHDPAPH